MKKNRRVNPDPEKYCSIAQASRTIKKSYHQTYDLFAKGVLKGLQITDEFGMSQGYWIEKQSVADYVYTEKDPDECTMTEAAEILKRPYTSTRNLYLRGAITGKKVDGRVVISRQSLEDYVRMFTENEQTLLPATASKETVLENMRLKEEVRLLKEKMGLEAPRHVVSVPSEA